MAITAAAAGYGTVDDTGQDALDGVTCTSIQIKCLGTSANAALVNIPILHGTAYLELEAGDTFIGRYGERGWVNQLDECNIKALDNSAVATVSWGVAAILG